MSSRNPIAVLKRHHSDIIKDTSSKHRTLRYLLLGLSSLYGFLVRSRVRLYASGVIKAKRLPCLVVSIGNITVGGTGKTPTTVHLARELLVMGYRPVILSRGYKGTLEKSSTLVSDGHDVKLGPEQSGDEPYLMANLLPKVPVVIGADRYASGCLAMERFNPDVILLDDAYQHLQLHRDLNLLLLDAGSPVGNGYLLPRGILREPLDAASRADAVIYTRSMRAPGALQNFLAQKSGYRPVFHCQHNTVLRFIVDKGCECHSMRVQSSKNRRDGSLASTPLFVFSGLAHFESFWVSVAKMGGEIVGKIGFGDHHRYTLSELEMINQKALEAGGGYLVTTDKDYVRLPQDWYFSLDLIVLGVEIDFGDDSDQWQRFLLERLSPLHMIGPA